MLAANLSHSLYLILHFELNQFYDLKNSPYKNIIYQKIYDYAEPDHTAAGHVKEQKEKVFVVVVAHAIADPDTVVVHAVNAIVAFVAMVGSWRF